MLQASVVLSWGGELEISAFHFLIGRHLRGLWPIQILLLRVEDRGWVISTGRVTGFDNYLQLTSNDRHSCFQDPHFVDAPEDFHVRSDSSAIGAGTTEGVSVGEVDLEGSPRAKSGSIDIGCYQAKHGAAHD